MQRSKQNVTKVFPFCEIREKIVVYSYSLRKKRLSCLWLSVVTICVFVNDNLMKKLHLHVLI